MSGAHFVGIDLGTTNSVLASVPRSALAEDAPFTAQVHPLLQLAQPGNVVERRQLPSFLYLAEAGELPAGSLDLPWAQGRTFLVGLAAEERGAEVPLRMIGSAKSWLSHAGVDRRAPILPPQAPEGTQRVSPVEASARYLGHLKDAWNHAHPGERLEDQEIVLTVPASFDAVARELTLDAARSVGLTEVRLLEEPQAAFYAWLARAHATWRKQLKAGDRVLVSDVGGGTSDFTLIEVKDDGGALALERVAVGEHLLLGGDNMDLALAHLLAERLAAEGKRLDAAQQRALVLGARRAKEALCSDPTLPESAITLLGRGSKLIGGKIRVELRRAELEQILLEGFFPRVRLDAKVERARRTGFLELGLPFVADTAITRHLAAFLSTHDQGRLPTHVLFNGGVFNSPLLRARLLEVLAAWTGKEPAVLPDADYDLAVARGAAYYGAVSAGRGLRIRGGSARSYYLGIETAAPAIPGVKPPIRALCVVPFGMEEGTQAAVKTGELGLVVGEPVEFRFLTSSTRKDDVPGLVLDEYTWPDALTEVAPLSAVMPAEGKEPGSVVPVRLEVHLTELGTLELWAVEAAGAGRWRLEFNVRAEER